MNKEVGRREHLLSNNAYQDRGSCSSDANIHSTKIRNKTDPFPIVCSNAWKDGNIFFPSLLTTKASFSSYVTGAARPIDLESMNITWKPSTVFISTTWSDCSPKVARKRSRRSFTWYLYGEMTASWELDFKSPYLLANLWYRRAMNSTSSSFTQEPLPDGWDSTPSISKKKKGPKQR